MAVAVEGEADGGVSGPSRYFLGVGSRGDPQRDRRMTKVVDANAVQPRGVHRWATSQPPRTAATPPLQLGKAAGHQEIMAWSFELLAWFALVNHQPRQALDLAQQGLTLAFASDPSRVLR
jgi:hypothetical protein